ncbi:hypothetical protein FSP39_009316 [Pinctada imbricata]|uniref:Uncharacterized protein n=1 Tax=Pinctada imbricata TaxID=66713 RepID=A0AA89C806_PINIB|nr:hypothetical protein FSP39_009316 [Pinctada imbricata]
MLDVVVRGNFCNDCALYGVRPPAVVPLLKHCLSTANNVQPRLKLNAYATRRYTHAFTRDTNAEHPCNGRALTVIDRSSFRVLPRLLQIEITYRIAWRRSSSGNYCDASSVSTTKSGEGTLYCQTCSPKITIKDPMSYVCTDFSVSEDWTAGENTVTFDFTRANSPSFYVGYSTCCWITLENGGAMSMSVMSLVNTTSIDRNGVMKINSSPVTSVSPVTRLIQNCNYTITIPGFNMNSYTCDPQSGGVYQQCVNMPPYDDFQITYCVSAADVLARTNNTRRCADTCREYCYLTCMAELYGDQNTAEVTSECICGTSGNTDTETQLPNWCLTPQGNCDFFSSCVPSRFSTCDNVKKAMTELHEQCLWFAGKSLNQNCSSNNWIRDVRKCFQSYLMTSVFLADVSLCSDFTDTLYHEAYVVCFSDTTYDEHFCQLPESFRLAFNAELVPLIPMAVQQDNAVNNLLDSMANC